MKKISHLKIGLLLSIFAFSIPLLMAQVEINPHQIDLGEWPIGGWQESPILELSNSSPDTLFIISSELIDTENVFSFDNISLPWQFLPFTSTSQVEIGFAGDNIAEGSYQASYQVTCEGNPTPSTAQIMVSAYEPIIGDIVENPILITSPYAAQNHSTAYPMRANYHLTASSPLANDVVYKLQLIQDEILQVELFNCSHPAIMAIYSEDFQGENGPMDHNALSITESTLMDIDLFTGHYYLIIRPLDPANELSYDIEISGDQMPIPEDINNIYPPNGAGNIPNRGIVLEWDFPEYTQEYRLFFGTTYPVSNLLLDWTEATNNSFVLPDVEPSFAYFWRIDVRNNTGSNSTGDISFSTICSPPTNLTAALVMVGSDLNEVNVDLTWSGSSKNIQGYNVYRDDIKLNDDVVTSTTYTDQLLPYNMDPCYEYWVEEVWDDAVSAPSNIATACVNGTSPISGNVTSILTGSPIVGAVVEVYGYPPAITNASGYYELDILTGSHDIQASFEGYTTEIRENVLNEYDQSTTEDFQLHPYPYPVDTVMASVINDTTALIEWDYTNNSGFMGYNIYRDSCQSNEPPIFIANTIEESYLDEDWNALDPGQYQYLIEVIYIDSSDVVASNCLDKDMFTSTHIEVSTCSGDAPGGAIITWENISDPSLIYMVEMDNTGLATIDPIYIGYYNISINLYGYQVDYPEYLDSVLIADNTTVVNQICEVYTPPANLYVTPTGMATWETGNQSLFEDYSEDFNEGLPGSWTVESGGNSEDTWIISSDANYDGGDYMKCDSYEAGEGIVMDEKLISPIFNTQNTEITTLEWDQNYQNSSGQDEFKVEVFDGYEWIEVYLQNEDDAAWPEMTHKSIEVSAFKNQNFQFRFIYQTSEWCWNVSIDNVDLIAIDGKSTTDTKAVYDFKIFHDGIHTDNTINNFYQYGDNEVLTPGETYLAEVVSHFVTGLSDPAEFQWTYIPSGGFIGPTMLEVTQIEGTNDMLILWENLAPIELIEVNQNYGPPQSAFYQEFEHGYGVVYELTAYPDAMINAVDFRHSSWGNTGIWDYNIHVIDWDSKTSLAELGPFQTMADDTWENQIYLGEIVANGANEVAILVEPLGNTPHNAYPRLDTDGASDAQGSIYGSLEDLENMDSSPLGNFLMDLWIQTSNAGKQMIGAKEIPNYEAIGTNVYRNDSLMAYIPHPDTFYIDQNVSSGNLSYCVATVYTADGGAHTWTSLVDEICVEDIILPPTCDPPYNLDLNEIAWGEDELIELFWEQPAENAQDVLGYNIYRDGVLKNPLPVIDTFYIDTVFDHQTHACWEVSAVYTDCISDPSNEVCQEVYPGIVAIAHDLNIYPNPGQHQIYVESKQMMEGLRIINYLGQIIQEKTTINSLYIRLDTKHFENGIYIIEIKSKTGLQKAKFLIQK